MASLRDMVSEYQDDLRNGVAWLAFWREGRSWQAEAFHLDLDDTLYPEDRARLAEIQDRPRHHHHGDERRAQAFLRRPQ